MSKLNKEIMLEFLNNKYEECVNEQKNSDNKFIVMGYANQLSTIHEIINYVNQFEE